MNIIIHYKAAFVFKCRVQIEPIISGYAHAEGRTCSGKRLYYLALYSLQLAQERCASNEECACISETNCENGYFHIYSWVFCKK